MFKFASLCVFLRLLLVGEAICYAESPNRDAADPDNAIALARVELFPAGQGVFEYEAKETGNVSVTLPLNRSELDDLLKSLVIRGFDNAQVDYETNGDRKNLISQLIGSDKTTTRAELLQGMKGYSITLSDESHQVSGVIMTVELQFAGESQQGRDIEVVTLRTKQGVEQHVLTHKSTIRFDDETVQSQMDNALRKLTKPVAERKNATLHFQKKVKGPAGFSFQTETAAWKCSYRIAKIEGEHQLVVSAVIDNNSGIDWKDVELVLIVDQPLGFHAPLSTVYRTARARMPIPSPFSAAPPTLAPGAKQRNGQLLVEESSGFDPSSESQSSRAIGMGGMGMGGMGGMGGGMGGMGGSMGGSYSAPQNEGTAAVRGSDNDEFNSQFGMSFPAGDFTPGLSGQRVHIRLPHVTIAAGASETLFLPSIPNNIEDVRIYVESVSKNHPLSAFQITLQQGYQLPGGPGTVWSDAGYAGDIMIPRLVARIPQSVTYSMDALLEIHKEIQDVHRSKTTYHFDKEDNLCATKIDERFVRYTLVNEGSKGQSVAIEHVPTEKKWEPVPQGEQIGMSGLRSYRYKVTVPANKTVTYDVEEQETTTTKWSKDTNWIQLKSLMADADMPMEIRERLSKRVSLLEGYGVLQANENKWMRKKEAAVGEQKRIKELMPALHREDELHVRYLKKLASLESEIETTSELISANRKELEGRKSLLDASGFK